MKKTINSTHDENTYQEIHNYHIPEFIINIFRICPEHFTNSDCLFWEL